MVWYDNNETLLEVDEKVTLKTTFEYNTIFFKKLPTLMHVVFHLWPNLCSFYVLYWVSLFSRLSKVVCNYR